MIKLLTRLAPLVALTSLAMPSIGQSAPAAIATSNADLAAVTAHLRATETMTADFIQTDRAGKTLTGKLSLKRPGKIRFQYQPGVPILIVGDGKSLYFIDYSVKQVSRWPIGNSPLGVLLDPSRDISRFAKALPTGDPRILLLEARDPRHAEYGVITMAFSRNAAMPAGLKLEGWVMVDAQNNRTSVKLSNQRFNAPVGDETFRWNDPRGSGPRR